MRDQDLPFQPLLLGHKLTPACKGPSDKIKTGQCGAPSYSNATRKEFRLSRLFQVTGQLMGMLMICRGGDGRGMIF